MKLNNRDKKLLLILGIVLVFVVPMILGFKPLFEKTKDLKEKNKKLEARIDELQELYDKKEYYLTSIDEMKSTEKEILKGFDQGLAQENVIMFIRNQSLETPFVIKTINFGAPLTNELRPVTFDEEGKQTDGLVFIERQTTVEFNATYEQLKKFLDSILKQPEKMNLISVNAKYDDKTGRLEGAFILEQYAFENADPERVYTDIPIPSLGHGNVDKGGIFGKFIEDEDIRTAVYGPDEEETAAEEE